jgi:hypothetical protein
MKALRNSLFAAVGFAILVGALVLGGPQVVRADDDDDDGRREICPCYTRDVINATVLGLPGFVVDAGETREEMGLRDPTIPTVFCAGPEGPDGLELDMEVLGFVSEMSEPPVVELSVGFLEIEGSCRISVDHPDFPPSFVLLGTEEEGISRRQMRACRRAIVRSLPWQFCQFDDE